MGCSPLPARLALSSIAQREIWGRFKKLKKKKKSDQGVWGEDFGTESREWWRRLHPPPLPANRIPTRQIYGRRAQVGASQIKCYFTCAIYFVGDAINHFHWGRRWGGGREKKYTAAIWEGFFRHKSPQRFTHRADLPACAWQTNAAVKNWCPPLTLLWRQLAWNTSRCCTTRTHYQKGSRYFNYRNIYK